ncbi:hypothetical protein J1N35_014592 [Gossypium stocksii]|uniref:Uncharacterized protein n=1 Tax=Gossypium stocksii TaxID=47602 RepID=A0A9D4A9X1_9ROSI|nr:hypothetical protein J1N35_014592 [Gossypium stocksii]
MATTNSADSVSLDFDPTVFTDDHVDHSFPWHEVVKLEDGTYIYPSLIIAFTDAHMACDVWTTTMNLFVANSGAKQLRIQHELHSLKKEISGSRILKEENIEIMLVGLLPKYDAIVSSTSLLPDIFPFQRLVDALVECENRQARAVQDVALHANLVESVVSQEADGAIRGGRVPTRGLREVFVLTFNVRFTVGMVTSLNNAITATTGIGGTTVSSFDATLRQFDLCSNEPVWARVSYGQSNFDSSQYYLVADYHDGLLRGSNVVYAPNASGLHMGHPSSGPNMVHMPRVNSRPQASGPQVNGREIELLNSGGLCTNGFPSARPTAPLVPNGPSSNCVQVDSTFGFGPSFGPTGGGVVLWSTKPQAHVYSGSDPCIRLPLVGDLHASDYSDSSASHNNTT